MFEALDSMPWWSFCAALTFGTAIYGIGMRFVNAQIHPSFFAAIFAGTSCIILITLTFFYALANPLEMTSRSMALAIFGGILLVGVDYGVIKMYRHGAPVSLGMPIIRISLSLGTALIGFIFFHESLTLSKAAGIVLGCIGIYLALQRPKENI
mgnify:CR=1 FL=1